jgi:hypothetical protein
MNSFQVIVLSIAVVVLVLVLTFIGVVMSKQNSSKVYPPTMGDCPDYWEVRADGKGCNVPLQGKPNSASKKFTPDTKALIEDTKVASGQYINFKDNAWTNVCTKKCWATDNGIKWDGVTNYNGTCSC